MYSDIPNDVPPYEYTFVTDQCGNYGQEGDCYNREHSFPKSWFGNVAPMATDLFHLYLTDGYVNGHRSNLPYSEVSSPNWTSQNGSKKGPNTYPGSTGNAFEPIFEYRGDFARTYFYFEYRGDFARTYFYMVTRYMDQVSSWNSSMLSGDDLSTWAMNMLMDWHDDDPVSQKEIDRNDEVYAIQGNRNPFIDHPEYVSNIYDPTLLIKEHSEMNSFVYESVFHFREERELQSFRVYSVVGQELVNLAEPNRKDIELNELKDGVYIIVFSTAGREYLLRFRK